MGRDVAGGFLMTRNDVAKESRENPDQWIVWGGTGRKMSACLSLEDATNESIKYVYDRCDAFGDRISSILIFCAGHVVADIYPRATKGIVVAVVGQEKELVPFSVLRATCACPSEGNQE